MSQREVYAPDFPTEARLSSPEVPAEPAVVEKAPRERPPKSGGWIGRACKVILAASLTGALVHWESQRVDSRLPEFDDLALVQLQKFLPPGKNGPLVLESRPDTHTRVFAPARDGMPLPVELWEFSNEDRSTLLEWPPGPVDMAMLLPQLTARNCSVIALAQTPSWTAPTESTLATRTLNVAHNALGNGPDLVAAVEPAFSSAPVDDAAERLASWPALEASKVRGDQTRIPEVNDPGPQISTGTGIEAADLGFSRLLLVDPLTAPPGRVAIPLLARANGRIICSLPLLAISRARGIELSQLDVHLGTAILMGNDAIPVDERGCLLLPVHFSDRVRKFSPLDLEAPAPVAHGLPAVIGNEALPALGGKSSPDGGANSGVWMAAAMGAAKANEFGLPLRILKRAPLATSVVLAAAVTAAALISLALRRSLRLWIAGAMLAALFLASRHAADSLGVFQGASFALAVWLAAFATAFVQPRPGK